MHRLVVLIAVLALSLAPAGLAQAQLGGPNAPTPLTEPPPPAPVQNDLDDEGLTGLQQVLIFGAAALVLGLIAFVIVRDARRSAPADKRSGKSGSGSGPASTGPKAKRGAAASTVAAADSSASAIRARERQQAKRAKAKAKAVREQRKRNRPR